MTMAADKQDKVLNVPTLRFPEFKDDWNDYRLRDLCTFHSGGTPSIDNVEYWEGEIPFVSAVAMHNTHIERTPLTLTEKGLRNGSKQLEAGNLLLLVRGSMLWNKIPICYNDVDVAFNQDVKGIVPNSKTTSLFLLNWIQSHENRIKYMVTGTGIGAGKLDSEDLLALNVKLPSLNEQKKIEKFLSLIDERIETQIRIIEELKLFRSAIYQRVFSSMHCETVALCKIADIIKGKQINGTELYDTGDYYVMNGGTVPSGYYDDYNTPANTITISEGGNSCGYVQFNDVPFWSGGHCYTLSISSSQIDLRYLFHYLKYREQDIMALRIGSGLPNIQKKNLERFQILIPTFDEQHRCSKIFDSLQHKEVVEASLLNKWQTQKKYLLRQMFI